MKLLAIFGMILLLIACSVPEVRTPAPTPEAIHLIYPASLKYWADRTAACATSNPLIALFFHQYPLLDTQGAANSIELIFGEPLITNSPSYLSQVGNEQITVFVNKGNDLNQLSAEKLQSIFSGKTSSWENGKGQPIHVWVLPGGDPIRTYFDRAVLKSIPLTSQAMLAPDPGAMLEAVSGDPDAIGYLPKSLLSSNDPSLHAMLKLIQLDSPLQEELQKPVIASTKGEPEGLIRELLVCIQTVIQ
jgi:hypothetical protein